MDVSDDASVDQAIESIVGMTARLDVVVNNAGVAYWGPLEAFTLDQARDQFDTNVFGVLRVNRAVLHTCAARAAACSCRSGLSPGAW